MIKELIRYELPYMETKIMMPCNSVVISVSSEKGLEKNPIFLHVIQEILESDDDTVYYEQRTFVIMENGYILKKSVEYIGLCQFQNNKTLHIFEILSDK